MPRSNVLAEPGVHSGVGGLQQLLHNVLETRVNCREIEKERKGETEIRRKRKGEKERKKEKRRKSER